MNFISQLLESTNFWNIKQAEDESNYRNRIVSQIADLIDEGLLKDHTFENGTLSLAEDILLTLAQKANSDFYNMRDLTTSVLNSSKGKIFSALIDYSMYFSHLIIEGEERKWKESIKSEFNTRLDRDFEPSVEFSYILGKYISHLFI